MSDDAQPAETNPPAERPIIAMLTLVACRHCRRRRGANLAATGRAEPMPERGTCPHGKPLRTVWAPGYGPDAEPPPRPGTPEERRQGPV